MSTSDVKVTLYTNFLSPNGLKVIIYLEALKASYSTFSYRIELLDLSKNVQKEPWFIKFNPNGRVPVILDHSRGDFPVFESAAILLYLDQHYDQDKKFSFDSRVHPSEYSNMLQWLFFGHGGVGPIQSQTHYFLHYSPEDVPHAKERFQGEIRRLYGVLNIGLENREWLAGEGPGIFSVADMSIFPWIRLSARAGIESLDEFPNLKAWFSRALQAPGVESAVKVVE